MKYVWRIVFLGILLSPMARAETAQLNAFKNYDAKMKALENYSVEYRDSKGKIKVYKKMTRTQQEAGEKVSVELLAAVDKKH